MRFRISILAVLAVAATAFCADIKTIKPGGGGDCNNLVDWVAYLKTTYANQSAYNNSAVITGTIKSDANWLALTSGFEANSGGAYAICYDGNVLSSPLSLCVGSSNAVQGTQANPICIFAAPGSWQDGTTNTTQGAYVYLVSPGQPSWPGNTYFNCGLGVWMSYVHIYGLRMRVDSTYSTSNYVTPLYTKAGAGTVTTTTNDGFLAYGCHFTNRGPVASGQQTHALNLNASAPSSGSQIDIQRFRNCIFVSDSNIDPLTSSQAIHGPDFSTAAGTSQKGVLYCFPEFSNCTFVIRTSGNSSKALLFKTKRPTEANCVLYFVPTIRNNLFLGDPNGAAFGPISQNVYYAFNGSGSGTVYADANGVDYNAGNDWSSDFLPRDSTYDANLTQSFSGGVWDANMPRRHNLTPTETGYANRWAAMGGELTVPNEFTLDPHPAATAKAKKAGTNLATIFGGDALLKARKSVWDIGAIARKATVVGGKMMTGCD